MDLLLKRALCSILFFIGGINLIGYGMISNGYDSRRNPTWLFFAGVFDIEKKLLIGVTWIAGLAILGAVLIWVIGTAVSAFGEPDSSTHDRVEREALEKQAREKPCSWEVEGRYRETLNSAPTPSYRETQTVTMPKPQPSELSPEEVKERAIQEILRRW